MAGGVVLSIFSHSHPNSSPQKKSPKMPETHFPQHQRSQEKYFVPESSRAGDSFKALVDNAVKRAHAEQRSGAEYSRSPRTRGAPYSRPARAEASRSPSPPSSSPSPFSSPEPSAAVETLPIISFPPRNVQLSSSAPLQVHSRRPRAALHDAADPWKCPYCPFVQKSHRRPDLNRHIKTHLATPAWVCCGVPVEQAHDFDVAYDDDDVYEVGGVRMVGGCGRRFSRRDAMLRHFRINAGRCVWDPEAACFKVGWPRDTRNGSEDAIRPFEVQTRIA